MKCFLHLMFLAFLLASMNACMIANYKVTGQESFEKTVLASKYDEAVHFVIPRYYRMEIRCSRVGGGWVGLIVSGVLGGGGSCKEYHDVIGTHMYDGVSMAIDELPLEKPAEFTEHIRSKGLVCVVTLTEQINDDIPYSEILSAVTLFTIPAYTSHIYVLSYSFLLDYKTVKEYEYHITEKALFGLASWLLFPVMYTVWDDIKVDINSRFAYGPRASVMRDITKTVLLEAHQDGIL